MRISGSSTLEAPVDKVWEAILDPAVLARCLPGCESLAVIDEDRYAMSVTAGVAAIRGTYAGEVALSDKVPAESLTMKASGAGAPGTIDADVTVRLSPSPPVARTSATRRTPRSAVRSAASASACSPG